MICTYLVLKSSEYLDTNYKYKCKYDGLIVTQSS